MGAILFAAPSAMAATRVDVPSDATTSFAVTISGNITPSCTIVTSGTGDFGNITDGRNGLAEAAKLALPFTLTCNTPYEASIASMNGGLAYQGQAETAFAPIVEYDASLDMDSIAGGVSLSCDSARMRVAQSDARPRCRIGSSRDVTTADGEGFVRLQLRPGTRPLQMGAYTDELVLRIAPRVSG